MAERKIILNLAVSLDGYICDPEGGFAWISGDLVASVLALKKQPGKDIWLFGGAGIVDPFIRADAIDEYIVGIIPILLGQGRRLFHEGFASIALHLEQFWIDDGVVVMRYRRRGETLGK